MLDYDLDRPPERHPLISLVLTLLIVAIGFIVIGPTIGFLVVLPFYDGSMNQLAEAMQNPEADPSLKIPLYVVQGFATFVGLIAGSALFLYTERRSVADFFKNQKVEMSPAVITVLIVIVFMGVNSVFVEWNSSFQFPDFAKEFERWAREKEDLAEKLTKFLTQFNSPIEFGIALVVIAVLPAIGEELVFRGLIQNQLLRATKNIHTSIWIAAFLFSAIHFQFFGFLPRLLLGALFGYLYYWSGNLWLAILAHFVNNGFSVLMMYLYQQGTFDFDLESPEAAPLQVVLFSAVLTTVLLYYFYKYFEHRKPQIH